MFFENYYVIDLIMLDWFGLFGCCCYGLYVFDVDNDCMIMIEVLYMVFVIGGVGKVYLYMMNFDIVIGDGIVMVWCVGCCVLNMEFI